MEYLNEWLDDIIDTPGAYLHEYEIEALRRAIAYTKSFLAEHDEYEEQ